MISRREWLALVGKLGVIGAAAAVGLGAPAHAVTRPAATLNPLFLNVPPRPAISSLTMPRIVENRMGVKYRNYRKNASNNWGDFPSDTDQITWGYDVDGGQWFEVNTLAAGAQQVYASFTFGVFRDDDYIISFTVDSKSGTIGGGISGGLTGAPSASGTVTFTNPAVGRHGMKFHITSAAGVFTMRLGIGVGSANAADASIRYSNVMVERLSDGSRIYPSEYVNPGDSRAFPYTSSSTMSGTAVQVVTNGAAYAIPRRTSVLVIGDSFTDDSYSVPSGASWGDFPFQMRRWDLKGREIAVTSRGVTGANISDITAQLTSALAETTYTTGVAPWTVCIAEGGINDILAGRTLAQMQTDKLAQIAAIEAAGMLPVLVGITAWDGNASWSSGRQAVTDGYNSWLKTLGYPMYDAYADSDDGTGTMKTSWGSADGLHPGQGFYTGSAIMGRRLTDLLMLIGD